MKILVLYYSMYGHVRRMAEAVAEGAREVRGAEVIVQEIVGVCLVPIELHGDALTALVDDVPERAAVGSGLGNEVGLPVVMEEGG